MLVEYLHFRHSKYCCGNNRLTQIDIRLRYTEGLMTLMILKLKYMQGGMYLNCICQSVTDSWTCILFETIFMSAAFAAYTITNTCYSRQVGLVETMVQIVYTLCWFDLTQT